MSNDLYYDGAKVSRESALGKELMKWEKKPDWTPERNPYPKMLYKAQLRPDGKRSVNEVYDHIFPRRADGEIEAGAAESFTRRCQQTVHNEAEHQKYLEMGYRNTQEEALKVLEAKQDNISDLAAERAYVEARMSELAQREAAVADREAGLKHLPSVPEKPLNKGGRPKKVVESAA